MLARLLRQLCERHLPDYNAVSDPGGVPSEADRIDLVVIACANGDESFVTSLRPSRKEKSSPHDSQLVTHVTHVAQVESWDGVRLMVEHGYLGTLLNTLLRCRWSDGEHADILKRLFAENVRIPDGWFPCGKAELDLVWREFVE